MAKASYKGSTIKGIVTVLPHTQHDNLTLSLINPNERAHFVEVTGIRHRHIFEKNTDSSQLFEQASTKLLHNLNWQSNDIDVLICVTQTATQQIPAISCLLHHKLKLPLNTLAFDVNLGCSGYAYGLSIIFALLQGLNKPNAKALFCCGDISSQLIQPDDKTTVPIFSDAVSATAIEYDATNNEVSYFNLETDGSGHKAIYIENIGDKNYMRLNGIDVFNYSYKIVPTHVSELLAFSNCTNADVYIFHQANKIINDSITKKLNLTQQAAPSTLYQYGNTASASIPLTLHQYLQTNKTQNQTAVLCGFGVGFSVSSALVKLLPNLNTEIIFLA